MSAAKIAITLDESLLERVDRLVTERRFPNRSKAIQLAVREKLDRIDHTRLARECSKLDSEEESQLAEEGVLDALEECPEY